ncbi:hypothetical protein FU839_14425 [Rheinheimera tangshanensis]|uniref:Uncharacterized protein n=1 Tax=Rheinheimera tangshanensis TaxID=400153 RepID=A0A5C8LS94_9GAMM|nr:hypothetical protein FU839_14425 [Rheinheimera tangshanensis]
MATRFVTRFALLSSESDLVTIIKNAAKYTLHGAISLIRVGVLGRVYVSGLFLQQFGRFLCKAETA